jgi:hypothetical protein
MTCCEQQRIQRCHCDYGDPPFGALPKHRSEDSSSRCRAPYLSTPSNFKLRHYPAP